MYAVLFDIDGTLIQTGGAGQLAFAQAFREVFDVAELSSDVPFSGRSDRAIASDLMRTHGIAPTVENWERFRTGYLAFLPNALTQRRGRVLPGVLAFIAALEATDDFAVGLLTGNVSAGATAKLTYYGLHGHFAFGGYGDEATDRNHIAACALAEAERHVAARTPAGESLINGKGEMRGSMVIGDTVHDIRCARAIGAFAVAVTTGGASEAELAAEGPDLLLEDLSDFEQLLRSPGVLPD